jgi:outer membrane receptor for ferrienterochelin and colicins
LGCTVERIFYSLLLGLLLVTSAPATSARAQSVADEAELHFQLGMRAFQGRQYESALEHFLASNRLAPNRNVMFNIARVFERMERWSDAHRYYVDALSGETDAQVIESIRGALAALAGQVAVVNVVSDPPGATIYVGRRDLGAVGTTPRLLALQPGRVQILLELSGYEPASSEPIELQLGQQLDVQLPLTRIVGTIVVGGEEGAEVRLDSETAEPVCVTPCSAVAAPGTHLVFLTRPGRERAVRQVNVTARQSVSVEVDLAELTGSIVVSADERDALIEVDGQARGFTPAVITDVPVGSRRVRISRRGFAPVEQTVEVSEGRQTDLSDVRLVPVREVSAASRTAERIEDAPASISIITAEELRLFNYPTVAEALRGTRGFALTSDSAYHNMSIRGLGQPNDYNVRMLLLSDGATLNENILWQSFIGYDGRVDLGDVERIEVVRGPASMLYGTGAVSGVVNLVPFGPAEPTRVFFGASLTESSVARARLGAHVRFSDDVGARASISASYSEGRNAAMLYDEDPTDANPALTPHIAHGVDAHTAWTLNARGWAGPFILQAFYTWRDETIPTGIFSTIFDRKETRYIDQRGLVELRFEPVLMPELQLFTRVYANYTGFDFLGIYDETLLEADYTEDYDGFWIGGEARLVWRPMPELRVTFGAEGAYHPIVEFVSTYTYLDDDGNQVVEHPLPLDEAHPYAMVAGNAAVDWRPDPMIHLQAGARLDAFLPQSEDARTFVEVSPRGAAIFHFTAEDTLKVMGGRAFRAPTMYEQFYTDGGVTSLRSTSLGTTLGPEVFYQAEIEYTHRFDTEWSALGSVHMLYAENFIDSVEAPPSPDECFASDDGSGCLVYANVGEDQIYGGGDVEVRREFRGGWMFSAQYGFLQARYLTPIATDSGELSDQIPNAPEHFASIRGVVPIIPSVLVIAARATLEAPRRANTRGDLYSDAAVVADIVVSGELSGVRYSFGVYNLFDWRYALPVTPFVAAGVTTLHTQNGRTFMASLSLDLTL